MTTDQLQAIIDFHELGPIRICELTAPTPPRGFGYMLPQIGDPYPETRTIRSYGYLGTLGTSQQDVSI